MAGLLEDLEARLVKLENRKHPGITEREIIALVTGLVPVIKQHVADVTAPLQRRIEELESKAASGPTRRARRSAAPEA